ELDLGFCGLLPVFRRLRVPAAAVWSQDRRGSRRGASSGPGRQRAASLRTHPASGPGGSRRGGRLRPLLRQLCIRLDHGRRPGLVQL
ncbi:MAG: hypothetical protein AVDCRST_MAG62-284, partial [uncultured Sphingomonas sp.]